MPRRTASGRRRPRSMAGSETREPVEPGPTAEPRSAVPLPFWVTNRAVPVLMVVREVFEVPALFEPFRRIRQRVGSATGSGLGLSIVRSVALAHDGEVTAAPREGGGLVVSVTLPGSKN